MERYTGRDRGTAYFTECFEEPCLGMGCVNDKCAFMEKVCERLAAYEDIGPTPEQLLEIDKMYSDMCREVAGLKRQLETKVEGDLISRMALLKRLKDYTEQVYECDFDDENCTAPEMSENPQIVEGVWEAREIIEDMPTAYDVNKVVEQLQQDIDPNVDCDTGEPCNNWAVEMQNDLTEKHIEIVKGGGVDEKGVL